MNEQIPETAMVVCMFAFIGWGIYLFFRRYQIAAQAQQQRIESFNRLVEKFGSAKEFIEFAESPYGRKLLEEPIVSKANPLNKILRFLEAGVLALLLGAGFWFNGSRLVKNTDLSSLSEGSNWLNIGSLFLFMGTGLLLVAGISYIFVRRWHLANGNGTP